MIQFAKSIKDLDDYVAHNKYLVINYTAAWCGPCQHIKPMVDALYSDSNERYAKVEIVRVDLDTNQDAATRHNITSVPTFLFFENGAEKARVSGANLNDLIKELDAINSRAKDDPLAGRAGNGASFERVAADPAYNAIAGKVPKGYEVLNGLIHFGDFEALNVDSLYGGDVKDLFRLGAKDNTTVYSDADSQMLLYVPLLTISKVYSIWIKTAKVAKADNIKLEDDEIEETQSPNLVKVWPNHSSIISFDDAASDSAPHVEKIDGQDGWYECKLKFVRFQNVQSLNLFFDGDDEDYHTVIEKILLVGVNGESKEQGKIQDD
ncbi:thioredoxin [Suhomyces tanzawaensis NRRL Y-17324]|uniref:Thioredoxin n=1 Tax=Suhomyces tanzawaensis NRRL Y-17324 TaxID=984487 RepID=A0A1E4SDZ1_9ASCO|nr:thioredoxin [Suhomyces tanzawaensis NRRL Y-17324]ODV77612.1 thioredoxin [Suhomyces tanzawaensis NRRL Y-17324]